MIDVIKTIDSDSYHFFDNDFLTIQRCLEFLLGSTYEERLFNDSGIDYGIVSDYIDKPVNLEGVENEVVRLLGSFENVSNIVVSSERRQGGRFSVTVAFELRGEEQNFSLEVKL